MSKEEFLFIEQSVSAALLALGLVVTGDLLISAAFGAAGFFLPWLALKAKAGEKRNSDPAGTSRRLGYNSREH